MNRHQLAYVPRKRRKRKLRRVVRLFLVALTLTGFILGARWPLSSSQKAPPNPPSEATLAAELLPVLPEEPAGRLLPARATPDLMATLQARLEAACREAPAERVAVYVEEIGSGLSAGVNADQRFTAASLIKLPVMGAAYDYWEKHPEKKTRNAQTWMEWMITVSDNASTDRLIDMVGGPEVVTAFMTRRGWHDFKVRHAILNHRGRTGTNECSARDVVRFLTALNRHELVTEAADEEMWEILARSKKLLRIPAGVPKLTGVQVGNKTGTLSYVLHDSAIVRTAQTHYALCILLQRHRSESQGNRFCRQISRLVFDTLHGSSAPDVTLQEAAAQSPRR